MRNSGAGQKLKDSRENAGISLREMSEQMRVDEKVLKALEEEHVNILPAATYIYGYINSYCRITGLDSAEILATYPSLNKQEEIVEEVIKSPVSSMRPISITVLGFVVVIALITIGFVMIPQQDPLPELDNPKQSIATVNSRNISDTPIETLDRDVKINTGSEDPPLEESPLQAVETDIESSIDNNQEEQQDQEDNLANDEALAGLAKQESADASTTETASIAQLKFVFSGRCWIEVVDANNQTLLKKLGKKGQTSTIQGTFPFEVTIGYLPNVEVYLDGEKISLEAITNSVFFKTIINR